MNPYANRQLSLALTHLALGRSALALDCARRACDSLESEIERQAQEAIEAAHAAIDADWLEFEYVDDDRR